MADIADIRQSLADALEAYFPTDVQVSPCKLGNPSPPTLEVIPADPAVEFGQTGSRGQDKFTLTIAAFVPYAMDIGSQEVLDSFMAGSGPLSVKEALEVPDGTTGQATLGGKIDDLYVTAITGYGLYDAEGAGPVLGCKFTVEVYAGN